MPSSEEYCESRYTELVYSPKSNIVMAICENNSRWRPCFSTILSFGNDIDVLDIINQPLMPFLFILGHVVQNHFHPRQPHLLPPPPLDLLPPAVTSLHHSVRPTEVPVAGCRWEDLQR